MATHARDKVVDHMLLLCRGLARLKEEVRGGSTAANNAAGKSPSQSLADFQRLAEEVARLQLSIQVRNWTGLSFILMLRLSFRS